MLAPLACVSGAFAEAIVLVSDAAGIREGQLIGPGEEVVLAPGETIIVLDQSGEVHEIRETRRYGSTADGDEIRQAQAADPLIWKDRRGEIGGTRSNDYDACVDEAETRGDLNESDCERFFPAPESAPSLSVNFSTQVEFLRPASMIFLEIAASFDSMLFCDLSQEAAGGRSDPLSIGPHKGRLMKLRQNVKAMAPTRGGARIAAPDRPGDYRVDCLAVDVDAAGAFDKVHDHVGTPGARRQIMASYAEMRGGRFAMASLAVSVRE